MNAVCPSPSPAPLSRRLSVAPMMDWTDRHCRVFHRHMTRRAMLYTEMVTAEAVLETGAEGISLLPASLRLAGLDLALARKHEPDKLLKKALSAVRRRYDVMVLDCPPGLSILTTNALAAVDAMIIPVTPHPLDMEAMAGLFEAFATLKDRIGKMPELLGILLTLVDHRTQVTEEVAASIRGTWGKKVFRTEIPINVRLSEAPAHGRTIFEFESWSTGALAYGKLGGEVLRRARKMGLM